MLDLSEEPIKENIDTCVEFFQRMAKIGMTLEIELGITGGEEDGVDNSDANPADLYSKPEEVAYAYERLSRRSVRISPIAAAFGNVHGVYKPGNVKLTPPILPAMPRRTSPRSSRRTTSRSTSCSTAGRAPPLRRSPRRSATG